MPRLSLSVNPRYLFKSSSSGLSGSVSVPEASIPVPLPWEAVSHCLGLDVLLRLFFAVSDSVLIWWHLFPSLIE